MTATIQQSTQLSCHLIPKTVTAAAPPCLSGLQQLRENLCRHRQPPQLPQPLLSLLLLLQQLALAADVTPIALSQHILTQGLESLTSYDAAIGCSLEV